MSTGFLPFFTIAATPSSRCHSLLRCCSRPHSLSSTRVLASPAASPLIAHRRGATTRSWCCRAPGRTWRCRAWGDRDGNPDGNVRWPRRRLYLKASLSAKKRSGFIFPPWSGCGGLFRVLTGLPAPPPPPHRPPRLLPLCAVEVVSPTADLDLGGACRPPHLVPLHTRGCPPHLR